MTRWSHFGALREQLQRGAIDWHEVARMMAPPIYEISGRRYETGGLGGCADPAAVEYVTTYLDGLPVEQRPARWYIGPKRIGNLTLSERLCTDLGDALLHSAKSNGPTVYIAPLWVNSGCPALAARTTDLRRPMRHTRDLAMRRALDTIPSQVWRGHYDALLREDKGREREREILIPQLLRQVAAIAVEEDSYAAISGPSQTIGRDMTMSPVDPDKLRDRALERLGVDAVSATQISTWWTHGFVTSSGELRADVYRVACELGDMRRHLYQAAGGWPSPPRSPDGVVSRVHVQQQQSLFRLESP